MMILGKILFARITNDIDIIEINVSGIFSIGK